MEKLQTIVLEWLLMTVHKGWLPNTKRTRSQKHDLLMSKQTLEHSGLQTPEESSSTSLKSPGKKQCNKSKQNASAFADRTEGQLIAFINATSSSNANDQAVRRQV